MGNCIHTFLPRSQAQKEHHDDKELKQPRREVDEESEGDVGARSEKRSTMESDGQGKVNKELSEAGKGDGGGVMRVKIVLTKEELQWLMMQLNSDKEKRLENMLDEIQRGRKKVVCEGGSGNGWKPSLESIVETPECLEMDTSIRL